jgi:NADH-quinone oxidoreductase subunit J
MVLFLFVIMLLTDTAESAEGYPWKSAALGLAVFFFLAAGAVWLFVWAGAVPGTAAGATPPELSVNPSEFVTAAKGFGRLLYTKYLLPLEIAGFLLLVALVGVVSLSKDPVDENA